MSKLTDEELRTMRTAWASSEPCPNKRIVLSLLDHIDAITAERDTAIADLKRLNESAAGACQEKDALYAKNAELNRRATKAEGDVLRLRRSSSAGALHNQKRHEREIAGLNERIKELEAELKAERDGNLAMRQQYGAKPNETMDAFVGRMRTERDAALHRIRLIAQRLRDAAGKPCPGPMTAEEHVQQVEERIRELEDAAKQLDPSAMPDSFRAALLGELETMRTSAWEAFRACPEWKLHDLRRVLGEKAKR